ncbi:hypothetical protein SAMN05421855_101832 [Ulvibacter litoralis]|uniref:Chain length determinant protein n=2 Tax=Ulvibacter litoralis TaxID=227084 RepID=A0A1G7D8Z4_9FLAO|nr:hypothetical protein SAMN05421855_101832 [Ulvibacter litoralis]
MEPKHNNDEINMFYILNVFNKALRKLNVLIFAALQFIFRQWIVILVLFVIGVSLGVYLERKNDQSFETKALVRVNFNATNYVYNTITLLKQKVLERDSIFFTQNGFRSDTMEINTIEINPVVDIRDIIDNYEPNDRNLEALMKNLDFDNDVSITETFNAQYKYHTLDLELSGVATNQTPQKILDYINKNELFEDVKEVTINNLKNRVENNLNIIGQIDEVIKNYNTNESLTSPSKELFIVDKNFSVSGLLDKKVLLLEENDELTEDLSYAKDIVVLVSKPDVYKVKPSILTKKYILFPILFIFLFLFISGLLHVYMNLKEKAAIDSKSLR